MPSQAMQDVIDAFRDQQQAMGSEAVPPLEERRAAFAPAGRLHPLPDDGLAVALLVAARDAGEALPVAAVLMSPTVDLTSSGASMTERAELDPISTPAMLRQFASDYLAGAGPKTPLASPLFASLGGIPPLLIQVGTADLLFSDSDRLATAAAQAGVDVSLEIGEGLPHVYQLLLGTPEGAEATERIGTFLRARLAHDD
jgi:monoterpene epsilon-lactone hydrolase